MTKINTFFTVLVFTALIARESKSVITKLVTNSPSYNSKFSTFHICNNHLASVDCPTSNNPKFIYTNQFITQPTQLNVICNTTFRVRTTSLNTGNNPTYLYFSYTQSYLYTPFQNNYQFLYSTNSTTTIHEICFGAQKQYLYVLVRETSVPSLSNGTYYAILFYNWATFVNKTYITSINATVNTAVDQFWYDAGRLIIVMPTQIEIYTVVNFTILTKMVSFSYTLAPLAFIDAKISADIFMFSIKNTAFIYNLTSFTYIRSITTTTNIQSISKSSNSFFIKIPSRIIQYDFQTNTLMHNYSFINPNNSTFLHKIGNVQNQKFLLVFVDNRTTYDKNWYAFQFDDWYGCGIWCITCASTFHPSLGYCYKNSNLATNNSLILVTANITQINLLINTQLYPSPPPSNTTNTTTFNSTINTTIPINTTFNFFIPSNISINSTYNSYSSYSSNNQSNVTNISYPSLTPIFPEVANNETIATLSNNKTNYGDIIDQVIPSQVTQGFASALTICSMRAMPKFILVFSVFLNDLFYYRYHRKFGPEYPNATLAFMQKFDVIQQLRQKAVLFWRIQYFSNSFELNNSNNKMQDQLKFIPHDPDSSYYLYSTTDFYENNMVTTAFYFLILKAIHLCLFFLRNKHNLLGKAYRLIRSQTKWWTLVVAIIEINAVMLTFSSANQLLLTGCYGVLDKINLLCMYLFFFLVVFYSLGFYIFVYSSQSRKSSKLLIVYSKYNRKSFFFEPTLIIIRSVMKTFVHGFFIFNYKLQIALLLFLDLPFLILSLIMWRLYRNKTIFRLMTAYLATFLTFDLYFTVEQHTSLIDDWDREMYGFVICCSLAVISLLLSLTLLIVSLTDLYKSLKSIFCLQRKLSQNNDSHPVQLGKVGDKNLTTHKIKMRVIQNVKTNKIMTQLQIPNSLSKAKTIVKAKIKFLHGEGITGRTNGGTQEGIKRVKKGRIKRIIIKSHYNGKQNNINFDEENDLEAVDSHFVSK